uniref:DUF4220 domain-containing protein n=1 Tax=Aegilops tauschii TaxID=37682 RepID=R7W1I7_AEGTA
MDASRGAPPREGGCGEPRRGGHTTVHWLLHLQSHGGLAGYLVFANVKGTGRVAVFGFLWIVCATKWVQRFVFTKVLKHSLSYDMSAGLVSCYMDQMMLQLRQGVPGSSTSPEEKLKTCNYVIMGEERLVSEASGLRGYRLHGLDKVATVGTGGRDRAPAGHGQGRTDHYRDLILQGLFKEDEDGGSLVFEVLNNEVDFLSEYYHSVYPVVLASPYFFVVNYLVVPVVVCCLCATTTVLSGSGHVLFAFHAIKADKYAIRYGVLRLLRCLLERALTIPQAFFPAIDVIISYLLFTAFFLEQLIEFVVFLLSN